MQVWFHVLKDQVKIALVHGFDDFMEFDDIFMFHLVEEGDFSVSSLGIGGVLECIKDFFEGESLLGFFVGDFPDMTIGSTSEKFFGFVEFEDVRLNVFGHEKKKEEFKIEIKRK